MYIDKNGLLIGIENLELFITDNAWGQLRSRIKGATERLTNNFNAYFSRTTGNYRFRVRYPNVVAKDVAQLFAVVTHGHPNSYRPFDCLDAVNALKKVLPTDVKVSTYYNDTTTRWSIECLFPNPINVDEAGVGSTHHLGLRLKGSDNGSTRFRGEFFVVRARCVNCTTISDTAFQINKFHRGEDFVSSINELITKGGAALTRFSEIWKEANTQQIHNSYDGSLLSAEQTFKALIKAGYIQVNGVSDDDLFNGLMTTWNVEPGDTAAAINRAITRYAQSGDFDAWTMQEIEEQAGELLFNRVYEVNV